MFDDCVFVSTTEKPVDAKTPEEPLPRIHEWSTVPFTLGDVAAPLMPLPALFSMIVLLTWNEAIVAAGRLIAKPLPGEPLKLKM